MRVQLLRWLPKAAFLWAACAAGMCFVATGPMVLGQEVEAASDDPPIALADEPRDGQASEPEVSGASEEFPDSDAPHDADQPTDVDSGAPAEPTVAEEEPDDDPQSAAALEESSTDDATPDSPAPEPASLDGVRVGTTTREQLRALWGKPLQSIKIAGGARETHRLHKLGEVRVTITEDVVTALSVHVEHPLALAIVTERLAIDDVESVDVLDEQGELLGAAYPPRGVLLAYVPQSKPPRVFQIVVEPIDAHSFLARAEARLATRYADCLADLEQALSLAPDSALAYRLRAEVALRSGDLEGALADAQAASELEPRELKHRLLLARVLAASGDYSQAIARVRSVIDEPNVPDVVVARAWCLWGDYLARSAKRDYAGAIKHHQQAIRLAQPLARHDRYVVRRAAKEVLLDAHLAVAYDIGWGRWRQKSQVVPKWIDRAAAFADGLLNSERGGGEIYLRVYSGALAALSGIAEPPEAGKWLRGIQQHGKRMYEEAVDPAYRAQLAWQLATALSDAVEISTARHQVDEALSLAETAQSMFDESSPVAGRLPIYNYHRGRLCYVTGAVYSVERGDHTQAVAWFDRAAPLLEKPVPAAAVDAATQGEVFVSMAVSYWEKENRREALRLTRQGLKLMERAVGEGTLGTAALAIPYGNLASMHEALGEFDEAKKCAELAARYESAVESETK